MWREKNFLTPQITSTFILSVFLSILYLLKFIRLIPYLNLSLSLFGECLFTVSCHLNQLICKKTTYSSSSRSQFQLHPCPYLISTFSVYPNQSACLCRSEISSSLSSTVSLSRFIFFFFISKTRKRLNEPFFAPAKKMKANHQTL